MRIVTSEQASTDSTVPTSASDARTCRFDWCSGLFCSDPADSESFHLARISSEGSDEVVGVELVCNDFADGTSSGPLVDITFTSVAGTAVAQHSASLSPVDAFRHGEAVIRAALAALTTQAL